MYKIPLIYIQKAVILLSGSFVFFYVYTGFYKVINIEAFKFNIIRTAVFPDYMVNAITYLVILIESTVVLFLLFKRRKGLILFAISMFIFSVYIIFLNINGRYEVCGCGGILNGLEFKYHLLINATFFSLAIGAILLSKKIEQK